MAKKKKPKKQTSRPTKWRAYYRNNSPQSNQLSENSYYVCDFSEEENPTEDKLDGSYELESYEIDEQEIGFGIEPTE